MSVLAVYTQDGVISRIIDVPNFMDEAQAKTLNPGEQIALVEEWVELGNAYISSGIAIAKQPMPLSVSSTVIVADGDDEVVIASIPQGVTVRWPDGQRDEVTDGEVRFSVDLTGTYTLRFSAVPYLDQEVTIEAVAAT